MQSAPCPAHGYGFLLSILIQGKWSLRRMKGLLRVMWCWGQSWNQTFLMPSTCSFPPARVVGWWLQSLKPSSFLTRGMASHSMIINGTGMNEILYELLTRRKRISTSWTWCERPLPTAVEVWSLFIWTTKKVPVEFLVYFFSTVEFLKKDVLQRKGGKYTSNSLNCSLPED